MKLNDALTIAATLLSAVASAQKDNRTDITDADLDAIAAIDDAAIAKLQAAIDRKRAEAA